MFCSEDPSGTKLTIVAEAPLPGAPTNPDPCFASRPQPFWVALLHFTRTDGWIGYTSPRRRRIGGKTPVLSRGDVPSCRSAWMDRAGIWGS